MYRPSGDQMGWWNGLLGRAAIVEICRVAPFVAFQTQTCVSLSFAK
jgi:hypothetical protein